MEHEDDSRQYKDWNSLGIGLELAEIEEPTDQWMQDREIIKLRLNTLCWKKHNMRQSITIQLTFGN